MKAPGIAPVGALAAPSPRWQRQPTANTCGQAICAMIAGIPVKQVVASMGDTGTRYPDLRRYLDQHGWTVAPARRYRPGRTQIRSDLAICRIDWGVARIRTHWVLYAGGTFLDPDHPDPHEWLRRGGCWYSLALVWKTF